MRQRRLVCSALAVLAAVVALVAPPAGSASAQPPAEPCDAVDVQYTLAAKLRLSDTTMGAGDGVYSIGPGSVVLRFANVNGQLSGPVRMRSYTMKETFPIESRALFAVTKVLTDSRTTVAPDACGDVAKGELKGTTLQWTTKLTGYRTDGTLDCSGMLCGTFGAPPSGKSELHIPPNDVMFSSLQYASDLKTFTMPYTFVSKSESPKQTAHLALAGRETRRTCVRTTPCP